MSVVRYLILALTYTSICTVYSHDTIMHGVIEIVSVSVREIAYFHEKKIHKKKL